MHDWFEALTSFEKIFWYISVPFTLIFVIQLVLSVAGLDGRKLNKKIDEEDSEEVLKQAEPHKKGRTRLVSFGLSFFSMRNFIVFLMVFGWVGIIVYNKGLARDLTLLIAVFAGVVTTVLFSLMFYVSHNLKKHA
jgi:hypothetical protein